MTAPLFCTECGARVPISGRQPSRNLSVLYLLTAIALLAAALSLVWRMPWPAVSSSTPITPSTAGSTSGPMTMPTIEVRAVIEFPTATATRTPTPAPPPTSTPIPLEARFPVCDPMLPGGTVCRPERPPTTATPYPECADGFYPAVCTVPRHRFDSADMETK